MNLDRRQIIAYAVKYRGVYPDILKAIGSRETYKEYQSIDALTIVDDDYPPCFWQLKYPPLCLFYKGDLSLLKGPVIGIVGSRQPQEESVRQTHTIVKNLKRQYIVVSGLARGIDGAAHREALATGHKTIGILANGIDYCYPRQNTELYFKMLKDQLILSEYPDMTEVERRNFPFRNRLIAALAEKLIIPEAKIASGTMITVDLALELNKEIYCLPKPPDESDSGNNLLLKQGANLIGCIEDIKNI